ncbi:MAG: iron-containing alcohol dehydrogenase [Rhizobiales bacterium]|nr:iron-containing alcohol dehydrogenase [Hyphomicrobiales bacterium]
MTIINFMSRIIFEEGAVRLLPDEISRLNVTHPLIITDKGVLPIAEQCLSLLEGKAVIFDGVTFNPSEDAVAAGLKMYQENKCDGIVSVGGGSAIDLAKAVGVMATHPGELWDYSVKIGGVDAMGETVPTIAIPTAAGTGAEVGRAASVIFNNGVKAALVGLVLLPKTVICDPELTYSLPPRFTAATGIDALSHGIETYVSTACNPPAEAIALDCVKRCATWLPAVMADPDNKVARREMMMASLEGGLALQKGLGAIHAATHPLGALGHHHGELNGILLPPVIRMNRKFATEKYEALEAAVGLKDGVTLDQWIEGMLEDFSMPKYLKDIGVDRSLLPQIAEDSVGEHLNLTNPKPLSREEFLEVLEDAYAA